METAVERRPGSKVALTITVEPAILAERMEQQFQKRARKVAIPGFRPGKAPRRLLEERLAPYASVMTQEAVEATIDATYKTALTEQDLQPLERGEVEDVNINDDQSLTYTVLVSVRPQISLPEYVGIEVARHATQITDDQVDAEIERLRERTADFAEIIDDGIQTGDYVTIDYSMAVDGQPYPDGDATGYPLEVGTDTFFPELNDGLLGLKQGETSSLTHTYPDDYSNLDLAGKTAAFDIVVQQVRRQVKPELTDDWARMISQDALQSVDALRERVKTNLQAMTNQAEQEQVRNEIVTKIVSGADLELPDTLVEDELEHLMHELEHRLSHERMTIAEYAEAIGKSEDDIRNDQQLLARDMVRRSLVLQEIAHREHIHVDEDEVDALLASLASNGQSVPEMRSTMQKSGQLNALSSRLFHEKVLSYLESQANITVEGEVPVEKPEVVDTPEPEKDGDSTE